jgi:hypothetical protein
MDRPKPVARPPLSDEQFEEKFYQIKSRLGVTDSNNEIDVAIYAELRGDPHEDAGVLAFRIKGQLSRGG